MPPAAKRRRTSTRIPKRTGMTLPFSSARSGLLSLPPEILQEIGKLLHPTAAVSLSQTCRSLYRGVFSTSNGFFWYTLLPSLFNGQFNAAGPGEYHSSYRAAFLCAKAANMKGSLEKLCHVCCARKCQKFWPEFKRFICADCFLVVAIDRRTISFLTKLPFDSLACQPRNRVFSSQNRPTRYYLRSAVAAAALKLYGRDLDTLISDRAAEIAAKGDAQKAYRDAHRERILDAAKRLWAEDAELKEFHDVLPPDKLEFGFCEWRIRQLLHNMTGTKRPKPETWVETVAKERLVPALKDLAISLRSRFRAIGGGEGV